MDRAKGTMNPKLEAIAAQAAENLQDLVRGDEEKILAAWNSTSEEAELNETAPKFRLALTITLDLDGDKMETALSYSIRRKVVAEQKIPDPAQMKLELEKV